MNRVPNLQSRRCSREEQPGLASHSRKAEDRGQRLETSGKRPISSFYALAFELMRSDVRREISGKVFQPLTSSL